MCDRLAHSRREAKVFEHREHSKMGYSTAHAGYTAQKFPSLFRVVSKIASRDELIKTEMLLISITYSSKKKSFERV